MTKIRTGCVLMLAFSFAFAAAAKHPWAGFKPGSWVAIKSSTVMAGSTTPANVVETKITLLEKTADKVILETELTVMGNTTKTKAEFPLSADPNAIPPGVKVLNKGTGTIAIGGRSIACETKETEMDAGGTKITSKTWTSGQVPGSLVKSVTTMKGRQSTAELVDFKAL